MEKRLFEEVQKGLFKSVSNPVFGKQHQGIAPGGAMDLFSLQMGKRLLKNLSEVQTLEIIIPPTVRFETECLCVLTGARYERIEIKKADGSAQNVNFATVFRVNKGDCLSFHNKIAGFRSYLALLPFEIIGEDLTGRVRPEYSEMYDWVDRNGTIRILEGPEYPFLKNESSFTQTFWTITNDFSDMGFRLSTHDELPKIILKNMISEAVADGTIQLTPKGPIVLLKHRQTVGGYPRVFNVISADIDLLGQYAPNQILRFTKITLEQALTIALQKETALDKIVL
ncbi:MAG: hydrolase [Proteobacteria bacterium]|nr:hydrolase [Pseudomonadota bacterium]